MEESSRSECHHLSYFEGQGAGNERFSFTLKNFSFKHFLFLCRMRHFWSLSVILGLLELSSWVGVEIPGLRHLWRRAKQTPPRRKAKQTPPGWIFCSRIGTLSVGGRTGSC